MDPPEDVSDPGDSVVVGDAKRPFDFGVFRRLQLLQMFGEDRLVRLGHHASHLEHSERAQVAPQTHLSEEDGSPGIESHCDAREDDQG
jgi:hypothetical protein